MNVLLDALPPQQPQPSEEQQKIIDLLLSGKNVVVNAVAGAGKSTSVLSVAANFADKQILQLTYNSSLRLEMCEKAEKTRTENIEIHTYHSFAVKYYSRTAHTDVEMRKIVRTDQSPLAPLPKYDIVVVDEAQDLTLLYYRFVKKVTMDMAHPFQILILGDDKQNLYSFKGADSRFLTMADVLWAQHPYLLSPPPSFGMAGARFAHTTLKTSYRITRPMAEFVNNFMLGEKRMEASRDGSPVMYIHFNRHNMENKIKYEIKNLIENCGAKPSDIFILAGSVRGNMGNVRRIENALVERGIPCNVPMFDNESMDEKVIQGKVVFSTFHCVKGRQRRYVFVVGFSQSYMDYMCRGEPSNVCPNTLYVACTRASERLYLLEEDKGFDDRPLRFLKHDHAEMNRCDYVKFSGTPKPRIPDEFYEDVEEEDDPDAPPKMRFCTPTDLIRFISEDVYDAITPIVERIFVTVREKTANPLQIPVIQQMTGGNYEEISDINGIAIPFMYYDYFLKRTRRAAGARVRESGTEAMIYKIVEAEIAALKKKKKHMQIATFLENRMRTISKKCSHTRDYLHLSNIFIALNEHLYFKIYQISADDYKWLPPHIVKQAFKTIRGALADDFTAAAADAETDSSSDESDGDGADDKRVYDVGQPEFSVEETIISRDSDYTKMDGILQNAGIDLFRMNARVDLITSRTVWEIKCTSDTTIEHLLQLVIYAWLWRVALEMPPRDFKILNIKTGEVKRLDATEEELTEIMLNLFKNKYTRHRTRTTEEFLEEAGVDIGALRAPSSGDAAEFS